MKKVLVELFYRDADNYKFCPVFEIKANKVSGLKPGDEVDYRTLGITRKMFHQVIGYKYDRQSDHYFVEIVEIEPIKANSIKAAFPAKVKNAIEKTTTA